MDKTEFTRRDLYELVWSVPMREAAKTLETNAWYLPYLCKRHQVPRPETGYWTKRRLGHPYTRPDLPPGEPEDVIVHKLRPKKPDILDATFRAKVDALLAREMDPSMTVEVVRELENPHPLVADARQRLNKAQPNYTGAVGFDGRFSVRVTSGQAARALLLLETLARACEKRGYLVPPKRDSRCIVLGKEIRLQVKEKLIQKSNPRYRENAWGHPEGYKHLYEQTGVLVLRVGDLKMMDGPSGLLESRIRRP